MLFVSLTPPGATPESFQLVLRVSDSASGNLRPPWLLTLLSGQFFCVTPGRASILINEWVSLWDHCTVWRLGLHHSHKFLSLLRKLKQAGRSHVPFLWILLTFILTNSVMAVKLRESVRSASYLTTQPRPFSPLQWSNLRIFSQVPGIPQYFSQLSPFPASTFLLGDNCPGIFESATLPQLLTPSIFWLGRNISVSFNRAPLIMSEYAPDVSHTHHPTSIFPTGRRQVICSTTR